MKFLLLLSLLAAHSLSANEEGHEKPQDKTHEEKKHEKKSASAKAYLKAKNECLLENKEIKGKELKDCIVKKQSEAK
jgi:biopolymer transport protein ExbD